MRRAVTMGALAIGLVLPSACGSATPSTQQSTAAGTDWSVYLPGSATPSPIPPPVAPTTRPPSTPLSPPPVPSMEPTTLAVRPGPCPGRLYEGKADLVDVVLDTGTATVSWMGSSDGDIVSYRIAAVPQDLVTGTQPPLNWLEVAAGSTCTPMSVTVTGLRSGGRYAFWLTAVSSTTGREILIGQADPVRVP